MPVHAWTQDLPSTVVTKDGTPFIAQWDLNLKTYNDPEVLPSESPEDFLQESVQNPAILVTSNEFIGLHNVLAVNTTVVSQ